MKIDTGVRERNEWLVVAHRLCLLHLPTASIDLSRFESERTALSLHAVRK